MDALPYILSGCLVGTLVGLSGVGGGALMTPILILLFHQSPSVAVGTDLVFAAVTKAVATGTFQGGKRVVWAIVVRMLCGSLPATALVSWALWRARAAGFDVSREIMHLLAVVLCLTAVTLLFPPSTLLKESRLMSRWHAFAERHETSLTVLLGAFLGAIISLTSIGAGAVGIFALSLLYPTRLIADRLVATDIAHALPIALIAGGNHLLLGDVQLRNLSWLLVGSLPAVYFASRLTMKLPPRVVRSVIGVTLGVVSIRLLIAA